MHMSHNRIVLGRQCTENTAFSTYFVVGQSRDKFAIDSFKMSDRRHIVEDFETGGLLQIEQ